MQEYIGQIKIDHRRVSGKKKGPLTRFGQEKWIFDACLVQKPHNFFGVGAF